MTKPWLDGLLQRLYPPTCVLCGAPGHAGLDLCQGCRADLPHNRHACPRCAIPLPEDQSIGTLCGTCQRHPPPFAASHAAFRYEDPVPTLVAGVKFRARFNLARLLGQCLALALVEQGSERPGLIIPVPLHRRRLRERGYNQALEVARAVSTALAIPIDTASCIRALHTNAQVGLDDRERRRNVHGAFAVLRPPAAPHVAILDDVVTTGSTATELSRVLRKAGVKRVDVWAVARTP
jgi:ComF family protein